MKFTKFKAKINGTDTNIIVAGTEQLKTEIIRQPITHYILLIDRSGSMSSSLNSLLDQVNETIDHIGSQNFLSVMWYSGPDSLGLVVRAAKASSDIKTEINKLRYTVGTTCFSHPLAKCDDLVSDKNIIVDQTSLILFTDGQPCVSWSLSEEQSRSKAAISKMVTSGLSSMTCIGYGNYYNREFLIDLADTTDHGQIMHNSRIGEFLESFKTTVGVASDLIRKKLSITANNHCHVTYLTDRNVLTYKDTREVNLDSISAHRNDFFIVADSDTELSIIDGDTTSKIKFKSIRSKTPTDVQLNYFYGLASKLYYYGKRKEALAIIVENTFDKFIADQMMAAFTNDEVSLVQRLMDDATFDVSKRYQDGRCEIDYLPKKDALCVMDIFNILFSSKGSVYYVPFSSNVDKYSRIGRKIEDQQNAFTRSPDEVRMPLSDLKWNKDKLNLNVLISISGTVKLNARAAKQFDLPIDFPAKIYNTHTFVKDGCMNITKAEFMMDGDTYTALSAVASSRMTDIIDTTSNLRRVLIDFSNIPIINQTYIDESNDISFVYDLVKTNVDLEARLKVVKSEIEKFRLDNSEISRDGIFASLNSDQIRVLSEHGISDKGVYNGIDNKTIDENKDSYEVRILDFSIAGFKTLPSVEAFRNMTTSTKPISSGPGKLMVSYYNHLKTKIDELTSEFDKKNVLLSERKSIEQSLSSNRQKISLIKLSKVLNNDFFEDLSKDDKGNMFFEKEFKMNVKSERKLQTI